MQASSQTVEYLSKYIGYGSSYAIATSFNGGIYIEL